MVSVIEYDAWSISDSSDIQNISKKKKKLSITTLLHNNLYFFIQNQHKSNWERNYLIVWGGDFNYVIILKLVFHSGSLFCSIFCTHNLLCITKNQTKYSFGRKHFYPISATMW